MWRAAQLPSVIRHCAMPLLQKGVAAGVAAVPSQLPPACSRQSIRPLALPIRAQPCLVAAQQPLAPLPGLVNNVWHRTQHRGVSTTADAVRRRKTSDARPAGPTASIDDTQSTPLYAQEYWEEVLTKIDGLPHLNEMRSAMDPRLPVGMTQEWARTKTAKPLPLFSEYIKYKRKWPTHVILIQIGDFYETIGIDALVMAKWLGNRIMNEKEGVPKAGVPISQRGTTVSRLVNEGFEVVVISQREGSPVSGTTGRMDRYVDGIFSPNHISCSLHGLNDDSSAVNDSELFMQQRPIMGIADTKMGYVLHVLLLELRKVEVFTNLTESAVMSQLAARGPTQLLFHSSLPETKRRMFKAVLAKNTRNQVIRTQTYEDGDITAGFLNKVTCDLYSSEQYWGSGSSADEAPTPEFEIVNDSARGDGRPQPPPKSTIMQLGIEGDRSIPNLLEYLLPAGAPLAARVWMSQLVMLPPPPEMALHVHAILDFLSTFPKALPSLETGLPAGKVVEVIESRSGDGAFFRHLHSLLMPLVNDLARAEFDPLWDHMLPYAMWMNRRRDTLTLEQLRQDLTAAVQAIEHVVQLSVPDDILRDVRYEEMPSMTLKVLTRDDGDSSKLTKTYRESREELEKVFQECESFRKHVRTSQLRAELIEVGAKREELEGLVMYTLSKFIETVHGGELKQADDAVVIQFRTKMKAQEELLISHLDKQRPAINLMPVEVAASKAMKQYSSRQIRQASSEYLGVCKATEKQARAVLRGLCEDLDSLLPSLLIACRVCVIKTALEQHALASRQRQWVSPVLSRQLPHAPGADVSASSHPGQHPHNQVMDLKGYWPYWLTVDDRLGTVTNDLVLDRFVLLTGPNMAGKSTSLRSVCAVALLANCGLNVPAAAASVPWYDAFLLRNFSGDSPMEGKSSFALEMEEVVAAGLTCSSRSLILMDELGKGTEVEKGTSLVYATMESWCRRRFTGICATHLLMMASIARKHGLERDNLLQFKQVGFGANAKKLLDGVCYDSQAEVIAAQAGLPSEILDRARSIQIEVASGEHHRNVEAFNWLGQQVQVQVQVQEGGSSSSGSSGSYSYSVPNVTTSLEMSLSQVYPAAQGPVREQVEVAAASQQQALLVDSTPQFSLDQAADVLKEVVASQMRQDEQMQEVVHVPPGYQPVPWHASSEVVYVFRGPRNKFYCGETVEIAQRLSDHRRSTARDKGKHIEMVYIPVEPGNAKRLEALVIDALVQKGFPMMSTRGKNKTRVALPLKRPTSRSRAPHEEEQLAAAG